VDWLPNELSMGTEPSPAVARPTAEEPVPLRVELHIPWVTFLKVAAVLLVGWAASMLWPLLLLVFIALFLAVTLHSFVEWLDARGVRHWASLLIVIGGLLSVIGVGIALVLPMLAEQVAVFTGNLPQLHEAALNQLPVGNVVREGLERFLDSSNWEGMSTWAGHFMSAGGVALGGLSQVALLLVIAIYLLIDGGQTFDWVLAFFSPLKRAKLRLTADEISDVIFGYVFGQALTSLIVMVSSFAILSALHVPGALMLAILAGVFDILPILGFFIATVPAVLLALSVSPRTAVVVLGFYLAFQLIENYLIVPLVYGKHLRVSTLTVLLGLLAGGLLAGIPGVLASLPVIASYSAIERIWLTRFLREGVSEKHELQKDQVFGERKSEP
jgi:predicted PurR-regulated permease PerM